MGLLPKKKWRVKIKIGIKIKQTHNFPVDIITKEKIP